MHACGVHRWTVPANIGVPAFGGNSLFGLFTQSIGENLAKFPQGPGLTDKFWCARALASPPAAVLHERLPDSSACFFSDVGSCNLGCTRLNMRSLCCQCRLLLITYHIGLFVTLLLGQVCPAAAVASCCLQRLRIILQGGIGCGLQVGVNGRKQGYW